MTDPIADLLTRIRNAQKAKHTSVQVPRSKVKLALVKLLKDEGFLEGYLELEDKKQGRIKVFLKYNNADQGVIRGLKRISRPGRRAYVGRDEVPRVRNGLGVAVLTTSKGLLTDRQARVAGVGGEVICHIW
jgi:small subunit ribosomal protein S8